MQGKYRSHLEIEMAILETLSEVKPGPHLYTQIMYKTETNANTMTRYLKEMEAKGWIKIEPIVHFRIAKGEHTITEKGKIILHLWLQFKNELESTKPLDAPKRYEW